MKAFHLFILLFCMVESPIKAMKPYRTEIIDKNVKSLQVKVNNERLSTAVIPLNGDKQIEINFDVLQESNGWIAYTITHCNADWTPSGVPFSQSMKGFHDLEIDDFANSFRTTIHYTNYRLLLPNQDIDFKIAGNYAIKIYEEANPAHVFLTACFSIIDPQVDVTGYINYCQDSLLHNTHQQINFVVKHANYPIASPQEEIKACVYQNNRQDNAAYNVAPTKVAPGQIRYEYAKQCIFEAGNEFRRMEFLNYKENGMHVQNIQFYYPLWHVELIKDFTRTGSYIYDTDQNGRFFLRSTSAEDNETEGDYALVHFTLKHDSIPDTRVYLAGSLFQNNLDHLNQMNYNPDKHQYEKITFLKQGSYNYHYLVVPSTKKTGETGIIEGNFCDTENEYLILIYQRIPQPAYDKLIGMQRIAFRITPNPIFPNKI